MKTLLLFLLLLISFGSFSQNATQYSNIILNTAADFRKAEPYVSLAADLVYSTPIEKENTRRAEAITFISKWMGGTSDFSFIINEALPKITGNNYDLFGVYVACVSKYALQKGKGVDRKELEYNSILLLANYCENPENNYKPVGEMKKMIAAKNQGKLQEYLDSKKK